MTPEENDVKAVLADFHARIRRVVLAAWKEWVAYPEKGKLVFLPRFRAVFVFDAVARLGLEEFADDPNIRVLRKNASVKFLFRDEVLVRFKKGNAKGVGSNIVTQAVLDFIDPQRTIPGLVPEVLRVEVVWQHDDVGIKLTDVAVVARDRRQRVWAYSLLDSAEDAEVVPLPTPAPTPADVQPPAVLPRRIKKQEEASE